MTDVADYVSKIENSCSIEGVKNELSSAASASDKLFLDLLTKMEYSSKWESAADPGKGPDQSGILKYCHGSKDAFLSYNLGNLKDIVLHER